MKKIAKIPSQLLSKELTEALHLNEQSFFILIPKSFLPNLNSDIITFNLIMEKDRISLVGPDISSRPRVTQSVVEESVT